MNSPIATALRDIADLCDESRVADVCVFTFLALETVSNVFVIYRAFFQ